MTMIDRAIHLDGEDAQLKNGIEEGCMKRSERKPEAVRQHRQGQNVMSMTVQSVASAPRFVDHSTEAQASRLLAALRCGPVSTICAAKELDIVHPPSTVRYLRRKGWDIHTRWAYIATEAGRKPHRVGLYVLIKEVA